MRYAILSSSIAGLLAFCSPVAIAATDPFADAASRQSGALDSPSGMGDPAAIICRAPQQLAGGGPGPKVCMHNSVWARLTLAGQDLAADGRTVIDRPAVDNPDGSGRPDAVTCRKPQVLPSAWRLRNFGPEICLTNATWMQLNADHKRISEDGRGVIDTRLTTPPGPVAPLGTPGLSMIPARVVH
jgi:hypothetical protein